MILARQLLLGRGTIESFWGYLTLYLPFYELYPYNGTYVIYRNSLMTIANEFGLSITPRFYMGLFNYMREHGIAFEMRRSAIKIFNYPLEPIPFISVINTNSYIDIPGRLTLCLKDYGKVTVKGYALPGLTDFMAVGAVYKFVKVAKIKMPWATRGIKVIVTDINPY